MLQIKLILIHIFLLLARDLTIWITMKIRIEFLLHNDPDRCQVFQSNSIQRQEIVDKAASFAYVLTYIEIKPFPTNSQVFAFWILNEQQLFSVFILKSDLDYLSSILPVLGYKLCVFVWKKNIFTTKMKAYFMQQLPSSHNYHVL